MQQMVFYIYKIDVIKYMVFLKKERYNFSVEPALMKDFQKMCDEKLNAKYSPVLRYLMRNLLMIQKKIDAKTATPQEIEFYKGLKEKVEYG